MLTRFVIANSKGRIPKGSGLLTSVNQSVPSTVSEGTGGAICIITIQLCEYNKS